MIDEPQRPIDFGAEAMKTELVADAIPPCAASPKVPSKQKLLGLALLLAALGLAGCSIANQQYKADERQTDYKDGQPVRVVEKNVSSSSTQGTLQLPTPR